MLLSWLHFTVVNYDVEVAMNLIIFVVRKEQLVCGHVFCKINQEQNFKIMG